MSRPRPTTTTTTTTKPNTPFHKSASTRSTNSLDRLRYLLDALTNPIQLPILNQTKLEQSSRSPPALGQPPDQSSPPSVLSAPSSLLRSQARLRGSYVDWEDGLEQVRGYVRECGVEGAARVFGLVSDRMRVRNSEARLLALYVVDALFVRSAHFRRLTLQWLHTLFELALGLTTATSATAPATAPLPPPPAAAQQLRDECVAVVRRWQRRWGGVHRVLELGWKWMLDGLGMEDDESARRREDDERKQRLVREAEVMRLRYDAARHECGERRREMQECIDSVDGCIEILFPPEEEWTAQAAEDSVDEAKQATDAAVVGAVVDSTELANSEGASNAEEGTVDWEEDDTDTQQAQPLSHIQQPTAPATDNADVPAAEPPADVEDWEDEYLRTGGSTEVSGSGDGAEGETGEDESKEGEWDVDKLVADAGLGSRAYELNIDFDANLGQLENEENRPIFQTLRDCCKLMQRTYLPLLLEWRYVVQRVKLQPPPASSTDLSVEARRTHAILQQRERQQMSEAIDCMLDAMARKLQQCAQLNITAQQRSTLLTQLDDSEQAQQRQPTSAQAADQQQGATSEKKPGEFFGVLQRSRKQAAKRVEKHAKKRRPVKEKFIAKPSDQHKKQKLGTQG